MTRTRALILLLLCSLSLSACAFASIPKEERYVNIDKTLELIDYKSVGPIIEEKIDNGDGVLSPSYKDIFYSHKYYDELEKALKSKFDDCRGSKEIETFYCDHSPTSITVYYLKDEDKIMLRLVDSSNGQG